jgi:hypothetical protein
LFFILLSSLFTACSKKQEEIITFDDSHPLSLAPDVEWALITDPYVAFRSEIDWNGKITGHIRRGEILQVLAKSMDKEKNVWYKFEQGWLPQSCLSIYTNRYKAKSAAEKLKD